MALPPQPLEFNDFSGGITENYLQGDPKRYQIGDNFFIGNAKELIERDGIVAYSAGAYSVGSGRVNAFFSFVNESILMPACGRDLFVQYAGQDYWTRIEGIDGNQALQGGDNQSQISFAEFQRQVYLTSDGDDDNARGIQPSKIFRDETNTWVARTAGLPRTWVQGNYTESSLYNKCVDVANALKTSMILHMSDAVLTTGYSNLTTPFLVNYLSLHTFIDRYSLSYLQAVTFETTDPEVPSPIPTPPGTVTSEATLFDLVEALNLAYDHHVTDSTIGSVSNSTGAASAWGYGPAYHYYGVNLIAGVGTIVGPAAQISNNARPDSVEEAAAMLDDLLQKWNWHRKAINTHSPNNQATQFDKYVPITTAIGTIELEKTTPTVTPDWTDIINYTNNLKYLHNAHATNQWSNFTLGAHKRVDMDHIVSLSDATTLDDAYLMIYWVRAMYYQHQYDAGPGQPSFSTADNWATNVTFTGASTAALTAVVRTDTAGPATLTFGGWLEVALGVEPRFNEYDGGGAYRAAKVTASASGTATLDRKTTSTGTLRAGQITSSKYHSSYDADGALVTSFESPDLTLSQLSTPAYTYGIDMDTWLDLANEFFFAWKTHVTNDLIHAVASLGAYAYYFTGRPQTGLVGVPYPNFILPTAAQYGYAFMWKHSYTVESNGIDYEVFSNPTFSDPTAAAVSWPVDSVPPGQDSYLTNEDDSRLTLQPFAVRATYGNNITGLPVLANTNSTNYDLDETKLQIYRTSDGGNTYYLLTELDNGTTEYLDIINDTIANPGDTALLSGREPIYTSGGIQGHDQPPVCKYIHTLQGVTYYGAITDADQYFPQRLIQSVALAPDATPLRNLLDLDDELTGLTSTRSNLLAMCKSSIVRVAGGFNTLGQGALTGEKISDAMGCLNTKSIVRTEIGVFFAGTDGFYYTDGFQLIKISLDLDRTYAELTASTNQKRTIYGSYDKLTRRIVWLMKRHEDDSDNSVAYVFHVNYGVKPSGAFTTLSNGLNFKISSLVYQGGIAYLGHELGSILRTDPNTKWDHVVEYGVAPSLWERLHIPYWYRSTAVDMGSTFNRKWITKMHLVGENYGNVSLTPYALRDLNQTQVGSIAMADVNYNINPRWGDPRCIWGDPETKWEYDGKMDVWRRFPAGTLRSDFMQVEIKPSNACVYSSSNDYPEFASALVNATTNIITIITPPDYTLIEWPLDAVGYVIKFATDLYETEYEITGFGADNTELEVTDPDGTLLDVSGAGVPWEIWGYKKEQRLQISSFVLHFALLGTANQAYPGAKSNAGEGNGGQNP